MIKISNQNYNLENTLKVAIEDFQSRNPLEEKFFGSIHG